MEEKDWREWKGRKTCKGFWERNIILGQRREITLLLSAPNSELASEMLRVNLRYNLVCMKLASEVRWL